MLSLQYIIHIHTIYTNEGLFFFFKGRLLLLLKASGLDIFYVRLWFFTLLNSVHLNWILCRIGRTKMCVNCILNKAHPDSRLYAGCLNKGLFQDLLKRL